MVCSYYRFFIAAAALATPAMRSSLLFHSGADFIIVAVWSVGRSSQPSATLEYNSLNLIIVEMRK